MLSKKTQYYFILASLVLFGSMMIGADSLAAAEKKALSAREKRYAEFSKLPDPKVIDKINQDKIKKLSAEKVEILKKMHRTRIELIKKDQRLDAIRRKILALSLELSQELSVKQEMVALNNALAAVEDEINELIKNNVSNSNK